MTVVVLVLVVGGWLAYLGNWLWNRRTELPVDSVHTFSQQLSVLSALDRSSRRAGAYRPLAPVPEPFRLTRRQARRRRREVFFFLVAAATVSLFLAVLLGGVAIYLHLLVDTLLTGYVLLLIRLRKVALEREAKVRYLHPHATAHDGYGWDAPGWETADGYDYDGYGYGYGYEPALAWERTAAR